VKRCELCDLPRSQCVHGLAEREAKKRQPAKKTLASGPKGKQTSPRDPLCAQCHKRHRYSRYRLCLQCGIQAGYVLCKGCGRYFQPEQGVKKKHTKRPTCRRRVKSSVWATGSAGAPGLGKRS
jgi:hypothetical protein